VACRSEGKGASRFHCGPHAFSRCVTAVSVIDPASRECDWLPAHSAENAEWMGDGSLIFSDQIYGEARVQAKRYRATFFPKERAYRSISRYISSLRKMASTYSRVSVKGIDSTNSSIP